MEFAEDVLASKAKLGEGDEGGDGREGRGDSFAPSRFVQLSGLT